MTKRQTRVPKMLRYTISAGLVYLIGMIIAANSPESIFGILQDLGLSALSLSALYYGWKLFGRLRRRLLWKVRNKIIVSYAFVGILPVVLLGLISWLAMLVVFKQLSALYLQSELAQLTELLRDTGEQVVMGYYRERRERSFSAELLIKQARQALSEFPVGLKGVTLSVYHRQGAEQSPQRLISRLSNTQMTPLEPSAAGDVSWIRAGFEGIVSDQSHLFITSATALEENNGDHLLVLCLPLDDNLLDYFRRRTSMEVKVVPSDSQFAAAFSRFTEAQDILSVGAAHFFTPTRWEDGSEFEPMSILLSVPIATLLNHFFNSAAALMAITVILSAIFLLVAGSALFVGSAIARGITGSVHNIYTGARLIQQGNFGHQIPSGNRDQLDEMANSFNEMSSSIRSLMAEVSQKERLEKEIEIATQVQSQLFPQQIPNIRRLEIAAVCVPARQVSGDYYDFLPHGEDILDIVVGDISGKGISAALMMSSAQTSIRNQLTYHPLESEKRISSTVAEVSRQLYAQSPAQSYSTLFLSHFEAATLTLTYCNGGHNRPLLFSGNKVLELATGGTVVGLLQHYSYEEETVQLSSGDLLVCYTDGVVEAVNDLDEQFGEERLTELVQSNNFLTAQDIQQLVIDQVAAWAGDTEQSDDITVVCLKVI